MVARRRLLDALSTRGYTDLSTAHLPVFAYPFAHGAKPSELAARANHSKQAMNNVLVELEKHGYVKRKAIRAAGRRLVYLSRKGMKVVEICQKEMRALQDDWAMKVGRRQFDNFLAVLRKLSTEAWPMEVHSVQQLAVKNGHAKQAKRKRK